MLTQFPGKINGTSGGCGDKNQKINIYKDLEERNNM